MGTGASAQPKVTVEDRKRHKAAEALLELEKKRSHDVFKLLLLGTGDSGKSTVVKQMKILHKNGFDREEIAKQKTVIAGNILHSICTLCKALTKFGMKYEHGEREVDETKVLAAESAWDQNEWKLSFDIWISLKKLWKDAGIQTCFERSYEFQLADSTKYFCDAMDRISAPDYVPSEQDILRSRASTIGIVEIEFKLRGMTLIIIDVGGQRSQRKKWIHCFENVSGLVFIAAISEYNQMLYEDNHVNRLHEALTLFSTIINSNWFTNTSVVLFLNKRDIFEEKIMKHPLKTAFPEYEGKNEYEPALCYIHSRFELQKRDPKKIIYAHRTCATDTKNIEFVMDACLDIIMTRAINRTGVY